MLAEVVLRRSRGVRSVSLGRGNSVGKSLRQLRPRSLPAPRVTEAQRRVVRKTTLRKLEYTSWLRLFSKTKPRISVFLARTPPPRGKSGKKSISLITCDKRIRGREFSEIS